MTNTLKGTIYGDEWHTAVTSRIWIREVMTGISNELPATPTDVSSWFFSISKRNSTYASNDKVLNKQSQRRKIILEYTSSHCFYTNAKLLYYYATPIYKQ